MKTPEQLKQWRKEIMGGRTIHVTTVGTPGIIHWPTFSNIDALEEDQRRRQAEDLERQARWRSEQEVFLASPRPVKSDFGPRGGLSAPKLWSWLKGMVSKQ